MDWFLNAAKAPFDEEAASKTTPGAVATVYVGLTLVLSALVSR